ncbi:DUF7504 family protein [Halomontanus rarus]|uniref:DUF7504 family protein n=1 Tax=Halomontanus rarus TaxID=3034020 RepID=UPI001A97F35A
MSQWRKRNVTPGSNTLVLVSPDELESELVEDWFPQPLSSEITTPVLFVSPNDSPREILEKWQSYATECPPPVAIIASEDVNGLSSRRSTTCEINGVRVTTVVNADLTVIASLIHEYLTEWDESAVPLLWFDSITALIESTSLETGFRFLSYLTKRVQIAESIAYYQLDPTVHDRKTVSSLMPLFDSVIE